MTKQEQLDSIIQYLEYANLVFVEPFSLISATVVESSYITGIPKNTILIYINKTFKEKYGEKYIKAQMIAKEISYGNNPDEERIMALNLDQPKERKVREPSSEFGKAYKEYTGIISKDNRQLYIASREYYIKHKEYPWNNEKRWKKLCTKYGFVDKHADGGEE